MQVPWILLSYEVWSFQRKLVKKFGCNVLFSGVHPVCLVRHWEVIPSPKPNITPGWKTTLLLKWSLGQVTCYFFAGVVSTIPVNHKHQSDWLEMTLAQQEENRQLR